MWVIVSQSQQEWMQTINKDSSKNMFPTQITCQFQTLAKDAKMLCCRPCADVSCADVCTGSGGAKQYHLQKRSCSLWVLLLLFFSGHRNSNSFNCNSNFSCSGNLDICNIISSSNTFPCKLPVWPKIRCFPRFLFFVQVPSSDFGLDAEVPSGTWCGVCAHTLIALPKPKSSCPAASFPRQWTWGVQSFQAKLLWLMLWVPKSEVLASSSKTTDCQINNVLAQFVWRKWGLLAACSKHQTHLFPSLQQLKLANSVSSANPITQTATTYWNLSIKKMLECADRWIAMLETCKLQHWISRLFGNLSLPNVQNMMKRWVLLINNDG